MDSISSPRVDRLRVWTSKSGNIRFLLESVAGFYYRPASSGNGSCGLTLGGLDVFLVGGKLTVPLDDGGDELFMFLKEAF